MPELPEVETIRRNLSPLLAHKRIRNVIIRDKKLIKNIPADKLERKLKNQVITRLFRRGKYLIMQLSTKQFIVIHLKMTGQLIYGQREDEKSRISFKFSDTKYLNFNDQRRFGELSLINNLNEHKGLSKLGPEPLKKSFTVKKFKEMLKIKKARLKPLLLDQHFLAGIGNIYANEVLFLARINPARISSTLTEVEIKNLHQAIKKVLRKAIKLGGSSIDDYVDGFGRKGKAQEYHFVYGKDKEKCPRCQNKINVVKLSGRGTYFCPACQK